MSHVKRLLLTCAAILASSSGMAQTVTPASAAASAAQAAPAPNQVKSWLTLTEQQDKFGTYSSGTNETRFVGGKGDARADGTSRKVGCAGNTTDPECLAIQALQGGRTSPSNWVPPNAPQLTGRKTVVADPQGVLGFDPVSTAGASASVQCRDYTITTPEVREENHCMVTIPNVSEKCSLGVEIEVDPDYVYKCLIRTATNVSTACSVGRVVTVDATSTYQCVESLRETLPQSCIAKRVIEVDANTNYVCENQQRESSLATCSEINVIEVRSDTEYQCINEVRTGSEAQCTVGTVVEVRADTNYQCIEQARTVANAACTVGKVVTIDPRFNYTCTSTPNAVTTSNCARKLVVDCVQNPCGGLSITANGLTGGSSFDVFPDWPASNTTLVIMEFLDEGTPAGGGYYYFEFDMVITGTLNPGATVDLYRLDFGSYVAVNGHVYASSGSANALVSGTNRIGIYNKAIAASGEPSRVSFQLSGTYCQPPVCTDTWDESECSPYKSRL